ncbi:SoxR reducing system RseC family protein [Bacteroidales bacterium OttesenSCG-928-B11]|nr:SoxR reducing system RseC family protein [Bacteroidales bacterium OttesenSCG-928-E04]MDL2308498.1 SoxR reducing system RseC family protein [Bacteroidales bacterium OttesenSCG-928-C03]MDL2311417.1 SoxR reducing system RseC family protein [Bacteroidales bacterium OttesenSCG-928-B11]MDL2325813.1 SoxR reducing system RseC family protein [Bacteroidales bacterium OttesenSCG-928-A14]
MNKNNICSQGTVKEILANTVIIEIKRHSACSGCHAKSICISGEAKDELLEVKSMNPAQFDIDEKVELFMERSSGGKAVVIAYVIPFITLFSALFITIKLTGNELVGFFVSILATALYYVILWVINKNGLIDKQLEMRIRKIE